MHAANPASAGAVSDKELRRQRVQKRIMDVQLGPIKSLPMTLFMLWMVGNDISLFSIMFVGMAVVNPIQSLLGTNKTFEMFSGDAKEDPALNGTILQGRVIFAACCVAALAVGIMKLSWMGLMPVSAVDWMDHRPPQYRELAVGWTS